MGFDISIKKGRVRVEEIPNLMRDLLRFAVALDLDVIPIDWMATGSISDEAEGQLRKIFGEAPVTPDDLHVVRRMTGKGLFEIEREHMQGLAICHPYEEWILTWNVTRGGLLAKYTSEYKEIPDQNERVWFKEDRKRSPQELLDSFDEFIQCPPTLMTGLFCENEVHIHCPWNRNQALNALEAFKILNRHSDGMEVYDGLGVWPNGDFSKAEKFFGKWQEKLGGEDA